MRVSVIGGGRCTDEERETAAAVGRLLARRGHDVVCGGLGGVMEAVCRGVRQADGRTIGLLPSEDVDDANEHVEVPVATGAGHARNAMVVMNGDAVVAIGGGGGTLSEIGFACVFDRPIAGIGTHDVPGVTVVETPVTAVEYVEEAV